MLHPRQPDVDVHGASIAPSYPSLGSDGEMFHVVVVVVVVVVFARCLFRSGEFLPYSNSISVICSCILSKLVSFAKLFSNITTHFSDQFIFLTRGTRFFTLTNHVGISIKRFLM